MEKMFPWLGKGGHNVPKHCLSQYHVAIIIPERNREHHLLVLLHNLHRFLNIQLLDYAIFVIEQVQNQTFNRAKLMNVGFIEAMKSYTWNCFVFHDVDHIPVNPQNAYTCHRKHPVHLSTVVNKQRYGGWILPGVAALSKDQFVKINGFSNEYWGWGGEDNDLGERIKSNGLLVLHASQTIGKYVMMSHKRDKGNPVNKCRFKYGLPETKERHKTDGLSNLEYRIIQTQNVKNLYTKITVDLLESQSKSTMKELGLCL